MYKIYINDQPLTLMRKEEKEEWEGEDSELYPYMGNRKLLLNVTDRMEKSVGLPGIGIYSSDYERLKKDFKSLFEKINAGGGIVENREKEILFIYRRNFWDLPKGKREAGETNGESALREVMEETGLHDLTLHSKIGKTNHTYRHPVKGHRILKTTHWYHMTVEEKQLPIPQREEDIEIAKWMEVIPFIEGNYVTFANIIDILKTYISSQK